MRTCDGCKCQAMSLYKMPNGQDLCDYCSDAWVAAENAPVIRKKREYSNVQFVLRLSHGTISKWAQSHGFSVSIVNQVLGKKGYYAATDIDEMSLTHLDILAAIEAEGHGKLLISDGYIEL